MFVLLQVLKATNRIGVLDATLQLARLFHFAYVLAVVSQVLMASNRSKVNIL